MSSNNDNVTRRTVLKVGAGGALATILTQDNSMATETITEQPDVYKSLGIRPIINAADSITTLGGSLMPPEVLSVWTLRDRRLIGRLPLPPKMDLQVIRQTSHRECYDHQVKACGVRLVDVDTRDDLDRAINKRTVMMFSYNVHEGESKIPQREWVEVARRHNIPTLMDAAADTPPLEALWKYNRMGYDIVVSSGGKAIRGRKMPACCLGVKI